MKKLKNVFNLHLLSCLFLKRQCFFIIFSQRFSEPLWRCRLENATANSTCLHNENSTFLNFPLYSNMMKDLLFALLLC